MSNGQYLLAQFGRPSKRRNSRSMLLDLSDLSEDNWQLARERSWRVGRIGPSTEWGKRARKLGTYTSMHSFRQSENSRWLLTQVIPYASEHDADLSVPLQRNTFIRNPRSKVTVEETRDRKSTRL